MPTHFLTVYELPKWAIKDIDRFRRSFLWRGEDPDGVQGALFGKLGNLYETKEMGKAWNKGFGKIRMGTQATVASVQLGHGGAALEESVQTS
jgi:hypothetical protein